MELVTKTGNELELENGLEGQLATGMSARLGNADINFGGGEWGVMNHLLSLISHWLTTLTLGTIPGLTILSTDLKLVHDL